MVADHLTNWETYAGLSPRFEAAFRYLARTSLPEVPPGRYEIDGDAVYLLIQDADLKPWEQGGWEAHRAYADIQLVIHGREVLGVRGIGALDMLEPYDAARDVTFFRPDAPGLRLPLSDGDFAILFPQDAHRPCIVREDAYPHSRRAVVKVHL